MASKLDTSKRRWFALKDERRDLDEKELQRYNFAESCLLTFLAERITSTKYITRVLQYNCT